MPPRRCRRGRTRRSVRARLAMTTILRNRDGAVKQRCQYSMKIAGGAGLQPRFTSPGRKSGCNPGKSIYLSMTHFHRILAALFHSAISVSQRHLCFLKLSSCESCPVAAGLGNGGCGGCGGGGGGGGNRHCHNPFDDTVSWLIYKYYYIA